MLQTDNTTKLTNTRADFNIYCKKSITDYIEFGKYVISYQALKYKNTVKLCAKTKRLHAFQDYDREVSDELRDLLFLILGNKPIPDKIINTLPPQERMYIIDLLNTAHIDIAQYKFGEKEQVFQVLIGEIKAGNNNKKLAREVYDMLQEQLKNKFITKKEMEKLISELNI